VAAAGGLTSIDNHTFLSDGRDYRFELSGGATVVQRLRAGLLLGFESITFHADPDVLAEHPDVDILASRGSLIPTLGIALSYPVGSALVGVFNRAALRKLELFDTPGGDSLSSRLLLFGAYVELRLK